MRPGSASFPIILAVCVLTAVVAYNYIIICAHFPDGGGVYSAARQQSRFLASTGALLLVANFMVTAALSGWAAVSYFGVPNQYAQVATMGLILVVGVVNFFGPKHSGSVSLWLAIPAIIIVVFIIIGLSAPHLTTVHLEPRHEDLGHSWVAFVGVILALSGVEAVANITGVMKPDRRFDARETKGHAHGHESDRAGRDRSRGRDRVARLGHALAPEDVRACACRRTKKTCCVSLRSTTRPLVVGPATGQIFGIVVGAIFGLLLFSAVNTAIVALIGVIYMMAQDGEMPRQLARLNRHGVPKIPLFIAVGIPIVILAVTKQFEGLAGLYAIGVVGAIAVNLGACTFNKRLDLKWYRAHRSWV